MKETHFISTLQLCLRASVREYIGARRHGGTVWVDLFADTLRVVGGDSVAFYIIKLIVVFIYQALQRKKRKICLL